MYTPSHFEESQLPILQDAIRAARLATIVTLGAEGLEASHIPVILDSDGPYGTHRGHFARANPQWRRFVAEMPALAIFTGPDAYISPSWYATKRTTGKVVPTWNYIAVHAYGNIEFFDDAEQLLAVVTNLTQRHEASRPEPWAVADAPADYIGANIKAIVGFRLPISRLEGKWKLSQNRTTEDRIGVIDGLKDEGGPSEITLAGHMTKTFDPSC